MIGIVGVCTSGKSSLISGLSELGYRTKHIAQEHSYVKDMWKRIANPDILIFLDASYPVTIERRKLDWTWAEWDEQHRRLGHAREHADLYILTDDLSIEQVLKKVIGFLNEI